MYEYVEKKSVLVQLALSQDLPVVAQELTLLLFVFLLLSEKCAIKLSACPDLSKWTN